MKISSLKLKSAIWGNILELPNDRMELIKYAKIHEKVLLLMTGVHKKMWSIDNTKYENYYQRIAPLFEGKYPCPVCMGKVQDKSLALHKVDPEVYFGVLIVEAIEATDDGFHGNRLYGSAALVTSDSAINKFYRTYHYLLNRNNDIKSTIHDHYILSQDEMILNAIIEGEDTVFNIQEARNIDRWKALSLCIDFNWVSDLYVLSCPEFQHPVLGDKILVFRPRLKEFIENRDDDKKEKLIRTILHISRLYFEDGIREIKKPVGKKHVTRKIMSAKEEWLRNGNN